MLIQTLKSNKYFEKIFYKQFNLHVTTITLEKSNLFYKS